LLPTASETPSDGCESASVSAAEDTSRNSGAERASVSSASIGWVALRSFAIVSEDTVSPAAIASVVAASGLELSSILAPTASVAESLRDFRLLQCRQRLGETAGFLWLGSGNNLVFEPGERSEKFGGFKGLNNEGIGAHTPCFLRLEGFQFTDRE